MHPVLLPPLSDDARDYVASLTGGAVERVDFDELDSEQREILETVLEAELTCATRPDEIDKRACLGHVIEGLRQLRARRK